MKQIVYADNAATTKLDEEALEAMLPFFVDDYANASQPYSFARGAKKAIRKAREIIASCINALPEEIYFTSGGTESDNWAIKNVVLSRSEHRMTITSSIEHHAVLRSCEAIERAGYPVVYLRPDAVGRVQVKTLEDAMTDKTGLVSIMLANNEIGTIQAIKDLASIAHRYGAIFHTDAVQAVGHVKVDVQDLGVDMLSASAHKFNGPKGVGFLYIRKGTEVISYQDGGSQENALRAGTENTAGIVGMAVALKRNCEQLDQHVTHIKRLEDMLIAMLDETGIAYARNGGQETLPGLISLSFHNADGEAILHRLDLQGICVSTGAACNSKETKISHVLQAIGLEEDYAKGTVRISLGRHNTEEDIENIVAAIKKILQ